MAKDRWFLLMHAHDYTFECWDGIKATPWSFLTLHLLSLQQAHWPVFLLFFKHTRPSPKWTPCFFCLKKCLLWICIWFLPSFLPGLLSNVSSLERHIWVPYHKQDPSGMGYITLSLILLCLTFILCIFLSLFLYLHSLKSRTLFYIMLYLILAPRTGPRIWKERKKFSKEKKY